MNVDGTADVAEVNLARAVLDAHATRDINQPRIMAEALTDDLDSMRRILGSAEWRGIQEKLRAYVENYSQKVVEATGDFQI